MKWFGKTFMVLFAILSTQLSAQDCQNITQISRLYNHWGQVHGITIKDDLAYIPVYCTGMQTVDISDPDNPVIIGRDDYFEINITDPGIILEMAFVDDYLLIMDYACFRLVDVSNPDSLVVMAQLDTVAFRNSMAVIDNYIFTISNGLQRFQIIDNSRIVPMEPVAVEGRPWSVKVFSDLMFVNGVPFNIFDISDLEEPQLIATWEIGGFSDYAALDNYFYAVKKDQENWSRDSLIVYDISDLENPIKVNSINIPAACDINIHNDVIFVSCDYQYSLFDLTNREEPEEISSGIYNGWDQFDMYNFNVYFKDEFVYVFEDKLGIEILDISNPEEPVSRATINEPGWLRDVEISGTMLYVADNEAGFKVIDISNLHAPREINNIATPRECWDLCLNGDYLFAAILDSGLKVYSIENPDQPEEVSAYIFWENEPHRAYSVKSIKIINNHAFVLLGDYPDVNYGCKLLALDISDVNNINQLWIYSPEQDDAGIIYSYNINAEYLCLSQRQPGGCGLKLFNISNPDTLEFICDLLDVEFHEPDFAILIDGSFIYTGRNQIKIINIEDLDNPVLMSEIGDFWCEDIYKEGDYLYVCKGDEGIEIFNVSDPAAPYSVGYYVTPGAALSIKSRGQNTFAADGSNFSIYDCSAALGIGSPSPILPGNPDLISIYPNPFNDQTRITFNIVKNGLASLQMFDPLGRRVCELLPSSYLTQGSYTVAFSGKGIPAGKYFLSLEINREKFAEPLLILK